MNETQTLRPVQTIWQTSGIGTGACLTDRGSLAMREDSPAESPERRRLERLRGWLSRSRLAGMLLTRPEYGLYLTGRLGGPLVVSESRLFRLDGIKTHPWTQTLPSGDSKHVVLAIKESGLAGTEIGVEARHTSVAQLDAIGGIDTVVDIERELALARMVKDPWELAAIEHHVNILEDTMRTVARMTRAGQSEIEIASLAVSHLSAVTGKMIPFGGNLGSGAECVNPDSKPSGRKVQVGESFFLDLYPDLGGYYADLTRCFSLGKPHAKVTAAHHVLEKALFAALDSVRPGAPATSIDAAARKVLEQEGYLDFFPHHTGHGVGLFASEPPHLVPEDETPIPCGAVLAIEPGVYIPGVGSLRLEVNLAVLEDGYRVLGHLPTQLMTCGPSL